MRIALQARSERVGEPVLVLARRLGEQVLEGAVRTEDPHVLLVAILARVPELRGPSLLGAATRRVGRRHGERRGGLAVQRQRLAHTAVIELDEPAKLLQRPALAFVSGRQLCRRRQPRNGHAPGARHARPRPTVTAENVRSGNAAVSASTRAQAPRRCWALTREKPTWRTTSPARPEIVPRTKRPPSSAI